MIIKKTKKYIKHKRQGSVKRNNKYFNIKYGGFLGRLLKTKVKARTHVLEPTHKPSSTSTLVSHTPKQLSPVQPKESITFEPIKPITFGEFANTNPKPNVNVLKLIELTQKPEPSLQNVKNSKATIKSLSPENVAIFLKQKRAAPIPDVNNVNFNYTNHPYYKNPDNFVKKNPQALLEFIKRLDTHSNTAKIDYLSNNPDIINKIKNELEEQHFGFKELKHGL